MLLRLPHVAFAVSLLVACAEGGEVPSGGAAPGGGSQGGAGTGASQNQGGDGASTSTSSSMGGTPSDGGAGGVGGEPSVGGGGTGGSPPVCDFTAPEVCANAEPLPAVAGDQGADVVTRTGDHSKFYKVHIQEQDSSIGGADLSYTVKLTSPPGVDYDMRIHEGAQAGDADCNGTLKTGSGNPESVHASWGDDQGFGGEDDSVWLVIEIVHISGDDCGPGAQWSLEVRGNT